MAHTIGTLRKETYYASSKKLGDIGRQLALVGIAVAWLFHQKAEGGGIEVPRQILWALIFLTGALAADFLRYAWQTLFWGSWCWLAERRSTDGADDPAPEQPTKVNWVSIGLLWLNVVFVAIGYGCLAGYLFGQLKSVN